MKNPEKFLFVFAAAIFFCFLAYRIMVVIYPQPDAGGVEGNVIYFIQRILDGSRLYTDPELPPYAVAQYSPLYYYLVAAISRIASVQAEDVQHLFMINRLTGLVLNILFAYLVYRLARSPFAISRSAGMIAAILAFIFLEITSFSRPDSLYHVFAILAISSFLRLVSTPRGNREFLEFISFSILALFAKQSAILLPLIAGTWFLLKRQFRLLGKLVLWYGAVLGFIFILLVSLDNISLIYKNCIRGIDNGISAGWFRMVIIEDFYLSFGLFFIPAALVLFLLLKKETTALSRLANFILVFLFIGNNLLAIKNGSNPGYFTEWWTLVFILLIYYGNRSWQVEKGMRKAIPVVALLVIMLAKTCFLIKPVERMLYTFPFGRAQAVFDEEEKVAAELSNKTGDDRVPVFLNFNTAESYFSNLLFRQAIMPQMDIIGLSTYPRKKFDYSDFRRRLLAGEFTWMIMRPTGPQKRFFDIELPDYSLAEQKAGYNLYEIRK